MSGAGAIGRALAARAAPVLAAALVLCGCAAGERDTVRVVGTLSAGDVAVLSDVAEAAGVAVTVESVPDVTRELDDADLVVVGDPGRFARLADMGHLRPIDGLVDADALVPAMRDVGVLGGVRYGAPIRVNLTSLVWYPPHDFARAGYEVPRTYAQLEALVERIRADGRTPWCLGAESAQYTGWVLTDWVEQLVLGEAGPDAYDRWVTGELAFASPEVMGAVTRFEDLALGEDNVTGGNLGVLTTAYTSAAEPMFEEPATCLLHRQGTFIAATFPEEVTLGTDVDVFAFPPVDPAMGQPLTGTVDLVGLVRPGRAAEALLRALSSEDAALRWLRSEEDEATFLSPLRAVSPQRYGNDVTGRQAALLADATVFRVDASQQMPERVGDQAFHTELIDWMLGRTDLPAALRDIDARRR